MRSSRCSRFALPLVAAALVLAACERAPTEAAPSARGAEPAFSAHPCSPSLSGPASLAPDGEGTYTLYYVNCSNPSVTWSVDNGAQVLWTASPSTALESGPYPAGSARVKADQCDFTVTANSTYNGGSPAATPKTVQVRDCSPLGVVLSGGASIHVAWNAVRADSFRVYREVIPRATGTSTGFVLRATTTGTSWTDYSYRISDRFDFEFTNRYRVEAYDAYGLLSTHTVSTYAEDLVADM